MHSDDWHRWGVKRDRFSLTEKDFRNKLVDKRDAEKDGNQQTSDDFEDNAYVTLRNSYL